MRCTPRERTGEVPDAPDCWYGREDTSFTVQAGDGGPCFLRQWPDRNWMLASFAPHRYRSMVWADLTSASRHGRADNENQKVNSWSRPPPPPVWA